MPGTNGEEAAGRVDRVRDFVPLGAPLQVNAGDTLPPVQPNPLNTCSFAIVPPSVISVLVKVMVCALAVFAMRARFPLELQSKQVP